MIADQNAYVSFSCMQVVFPHKEQLEQKNVILANKSTVN